MIQVTSELSKSSDSSVSDVAAWHCGTSLHTGLRKPELSLKRTLKGTKNRPHTYESAQPDRDEGESLFLIWAYPFYHSVGKWKEK